MLGRVSIFVAFFALLIGIAGWAIGLAAVIGDLYSMLYILFTAAISLVAIFSIIGARRRGRMAPATVTPAAGDAAEDMARDRQNVMKLLSTAIDLTGQIIAQARNVAHEQSESGPNLVRDLRISGEGLMLIWGQLQYSEPIISFQIRRLAMAVQFLIEEAVAPVGTADNGVIKFADPQHRRKIANNIVEDGNDLLSVLANAQDRRIDGDAGSGRREPRLV